MVVIVMVTESGRKQLEVKSVKEVAARCLAAKRLANLRPSYTNSLKQYWAAFCRMHGSMAICELDTADIDEWFASRAESPSARASNIGRLSALFSFAKRRGWVAENPCDNIERMRIDRPAPEIFSADQCAVLLTAARQQSPDVLPYLILCLFCGIRPDEVRALHWRDVDLAAGLVTVSSAASKTRHRRVVIISSNAGEWLSTCTGAGRVTPSPATVRRRLRALKTSTGLRWPQDVLRHTAASMMLARDGDAGKVAFQLGNSPGILLRHYHKLVSASEASRFWELRPAESNNGNRPDCIDVCGRGARGILGVLPAVGLAGIAQDRKEHAPTD